MVGPTANRTAQQRFEHAKQHLEALEAEIRSGDFSRAGEVLGFKNLFHDELRLQFAGGAGFSEWYSRLAALVQAVERFAQELDNE